MGNLLTSLANSTGALRAFERQLTVIQNNVSNASTPGYVRQIQELDSLPFDPAHGLAGGAIPAPLANARDAYLEQNVWNQQYGTGYYNQLAASLAQLESNFDLSGKSGVAGALTNFFNSFSQLSVNPNDSVARQNVMDQSKALADSFHQASVGFSQASTDADRQISGTVQKINDLTGKLRDLNVRRRLDARSNADASMEAATFSTLEELSELTDFTALRQADGTFTVFLAGQVPAVIGDHQYSIQADFSIPGQAGIRDSQDQDVTQLFTRGRIGSLLNLRNTLIPSYRGGLDQLAQTFADQINNALAAGVDRTGLAPVKSLFSYDPAVGAAYSLAITDLTPDQVAAALPSAPGGNGNALAIAQLQSQPLVNGFTFAQYYGNLAAQAGRDSAVAKNSATTQQDLLTQARQLRTDASSVSLDQEAAQLIQVQRSYQAASKLVGVLDELTQTLIGILR